MLKGGRGRAEWDAGGGGGGVNLSAAPPSSEWTPPAARALPWWFHHFITGRTVSNLGIVWPLQMSLIQFSHQWVLLEQMSLDVSHEWGAGGWGSGGRLAKSDVRGKWAAFIGQRGHKERIGIYKWNLISISIVSNLQCLMAKAPHPPAPHQPHCMVGGPIHCIMMWGQTSDFCYLYKWFDSQETQNLIRIVFQFPDTDNPLT